MGILQKLSELEGPAIVTLGDVKLKVGQSDHDAAVALLKFLDQVVDGETTYGDMEGILLGNLLSAMHSVIKPQQDTMTYKDIMDDRNCRALLDCLWWFRFIAALVEEKGAATAVASLPIDERTPYSDPTAVPDESSRTV